LNFLFRNKKAIVKDIISYLEGSIIGDHDIFAEMCGITHVGHGHDASAVGNISGMLFTLPREKIKTIKLNFHDRYEVMKKVALQKFKNHVKLINDQIHAI
jgi:hypothetical protein